MGDPTGNVSDTARKAIAWALAEYNLTALHERQADKALAAEVDGRSIADRLNDGAAAERLVLSMGWMADEDGWFTATGHEVSHDDPAADLLDRLVRGDSE